MDTNRQTTITLVGLLMGLAMANAIAQDTVLSKEQKQAVSEIHKRIFPPGKLKRELVDNITDEERALLLAYLREYVEQRKREGQTDDSLTGNSAVLDMALLGDDWAREMEVWDFWKSPRGVPQGLELLQDPKVIPMIGEGLFMEEVYEMPSDVGYFPTQGNIARVILHTMRNSPEFSEEVRAWAKRIGQGFTMQMMREWYRANEAALKAGDFKAVKPGKERADYPPAKPQASPGERPPAPLAQAIPPPATPPPSTPPPQVTPSATPIAPAATTSMPITSLERKAPLWPWLAGFLALTLLALLAWKRRPSQ